MNGASVRRFALTVAGLVSCLPADDRPPPGILQTTVSPSPAVRSVTTTADGWSVSFDRVVVGIGHVSLGDACASYAEARYGRVIDLAQGAGQKLGTLYGLGSCDVQFRLEVPASDAVLGQGVSADTLTLMRTPADDAYVSAGGIALLVDGHATKGNVEKTFHWRFRQGYHYDTCSAEVGGQQVSGVTLTGNVTVNYDIEIAPERLFLDDVSDTAELRFDPFASADGSSGQADGEVTLAELGEIDLAQLRGTAPYSVPAPGAGVPVQSLADWVYQVLFPRVPQFRDNGTCIPHVGGGHHH